MPQTATDVEAELLARCCEARRLPCTANAYLDLHVRMNDLLTLWEMLGEQERLLDAP